MKAKIIVNGYIKLNSQINQAERIKEELCALGVRAEIVRNFPENAIRDGELPKQDCDFCVFLDKDKAAAHMLEKSGLRLFNSARAIEICDDKMMTHIALADCGINMPDCIYAPLCYYPDEKPSASFLQSVETNFGYPLVGKTCYGSRGEGVELIESEKQLYDFEQKNMTVPHLYERYIECGGRDVRVIVIGGKFVCAMERVNENDFRSNIAHGGRGYKYDADEQMRSLCERVAKFLKLDYCGIDVLTDKDGKRYVCEVNSNAFFEEAERVCEVNIAKIYSEYIVLSLGY